MELTISNSLDDYLQNQLFVTSQSEQVINKMKWTRLLIPVIYVFIAFFLIGTSTQYFFGLLMLVLAILWFIFYPKYAKKRYRTHYTSHLKEHLSARFDQPMKVVLDSEKVTMENEAGNGTIMIAEWQDLINLPHHFLQRIKGGSTIIYPKDQVSDEAAFVAFFNQLNIPIIDHSKWKW